MYREIIPFDEKSPVSFQVYQIEEYPLHCHDGAIEIIFVLQGHVNVKASFEYFTLRAGDYVVVNQEDSHKIWRHDASENLVAVFHINLAYYRAWFPQIEYVLFACESFDLVQYKGQTVQLRQLLLQLLGVLLEKGYYKELSFQLIELLVCEYSLEHYYNRHGDVSPEKRDVYYRIMGYIYEKYFDKNLLHDIAQQEYYSKSYISHLFREVGAASFQDILGYVRVAKAERLLLETDCTILAIVNQCGFSDGKSFNRIFKKWFGVKPLDYRQKYQQEIGQPIKARPSEAALGLAAIEQFSSQAEAAVADQFGNKVSMTPLTLKNIGSPTDLLTCLEQSKNLAEQNYRTSPIQAGNSYAVIRIGSNDKCKHLLQRLEKLLQDFQSEAASDIDFWLIK
ncbi:MAG: helix-turn-helix domain-containing protein [Sporomusaceae bacterium]|nr:helix-turn-helix domain-containing protein [Sporomusaceae bacterium]